MTQQPQHNTAGMHKDWKKLAKLVRAGGYTVAPTKGGHYAVYDAAGNKRVVMPGTTSDHRAIKNATAMLRREGMI